MAKIRGLGRVNGMHGRMRFEALEEKSNIHNINFKPLIDLKPTSGQLLAAS